MSLNLSLSIISFCVILSLHSCKPDQNEEVTSKPNIVFILTDDQGWGDLGINGNSQIETPHIDQMSRNGVSFDNFFVSPVCSPTRAEILTGRYNPRTGVYSTSAGGERIDLDETTIADVFKSAGYATAAFGKWHSGMQYPYHPNGRGFDEFYGFCSGHWGHYFSPMLEHNGQIIRGNGFLVDDLTEKAMAFIEDKKDEPFFVYLPLNTPHSPMQVPDRWYNKYENIDLTQRGTLHEKEDLEHTKAALAMCENIDWNVGRIQSKLDDLDLSKNTIVIYLSDNGPNGHRWNGGLKGIKGSTDEGGVKSPLIVQWKGKLTSGHSVNEIASAIDFLPTLAELADISPKVNNELDGISLAPLLLENNVKWPDRYVYNYFRKKLSIRSQNYRLDHNDRLYDMISDRGQTTDVSDQYPQIKVEMLKAKQQYLDDVVSELPKEDMRSFPIGHVDYKYTQIPARDGKAHGNIKRSNKYPNCSFFTNWTSTDDEITWDVEVAAHGDYDVTLYYTCKKENVGANLTLSIGDTQISHEVYEAHDPPLIGMDHDRGRPRGESYVKDFKPLRMGRMHLHKGKSLMVLKADKMVGDEVIDFRLMMFEKV